ncbi:hypothetical protein KEH51_20695 [[Brevibacterium] frigoritolerans]|uniref:Uncharacterized protein n=1 Tax=Peribacillus frigoritolerans TaxID=450367 RepID=A0A941FS34_9BACI|nr:hypothetical protein [Peribacillus frigoritolerans]
MVPPRVGQQYISSILFDGNIPVCLYFTERNIILINRDRDVKINTRLLSALAEPNSPQEKMQNGFDSASNGIQNISGLHKSGVVEFIRKQFVEFTSFVQSPLALNFWFEQYCEIREERLDSLEH